MDPGAGLEPVFEMKLNGLYPKPSLYLPWSPLAVVNAGWQQFVLIVDC